jgi:hypothetical protein
MRKSLNDKLQKYILKNGHGIIKHGINMLDYMHVIVDKPGRYYLMREMDSSIHVVDLS